MRNLLRYFLMGLVLLVVALVSALTAMRFAIHGREVMLPDLRNKTPSEARSIADENGLLLSVERSYYSSTVPEGRVLSQAPDAGTRVRRGWEVRIALSLGPQRVTVPQLIGQTERAANLMTAQRGIEIESTAQVALSGAPPGQVIGQEPLANSPDVAAPKVNLLVAVDAAPQAFVMPSFIGQPLGSATNALHDAGFFVGRVTINVPPAPDSQPAQNAPIQEGPNTVTPPTPVMTPSPASIIVSQDPAPGFKVTAGSAINFAVR